MVKLPTEIFYLFLTLFKTIFKFDTESFLFSNLTLLDAPMGMARLNNTAAPCMSARQGADVAHPRHMDG
jgi:hypothetical protein